MKIDGLPVVDATKPLELHITKADVKRGANKDPTCCAAALACMREVPGCTAARVHLSITYLKFGQRWRRYRTPQALRTEIVAFDRGAAFEAGDFTLTPMPATHHLGNQTRSGSRTFQRGKGKKQVHVLVDARARPNYEND